MRICREGVDPDTLRNTIIMPGACSTAQENITSVVRAAFSGKPVRIKLSCSPGQDVPQTIRTLLGRHMMDFWGAIELSGDLEQWAADEIRRICSDFSDLVIDLEHPP